MHKTKEKEWLLERVDEPQVNFLHQNIQPMLSDTVESPPKGEDYLYELKWDGIRALITLEEGQIKIRTRNELDVTVQFPELLDAEKSFRATTAVFDGEIVCLDASGKPLFKKVINRMMARGETNIQKLVRSNPAYCYLFDCLYLDGRPLINEPLLKRKEWLNDAIRKENAYRVSEIVEDGDLLFEAAKAHDLEGIMAKKKDSKYLPGKRSNLWLKVKVRQSCDCIIVGYTPGRGDRESTFGAIQIAERKTEGLLYRGKVGTGFDQETIKEVWGHLKSLNKVKKPALNGGKVVDERLTTWVEPIIFAEISYAKVTPDLMYREPVFLRLRPNL